MNSVRDRCPILVRLYSNTNMFNLSSPQKTKPYLRLRITQFDIFVRNFTFYQYFPGKD